MPLIERAGRSFLQRDFRWMFSGTLASTGMQWLQQTALGWLVYDHTGSGTLVGVVLGVRAISILLLSPVSGMVADRYDRRRSLALTQVFIALPAFLIALSIALGSVATWQLVLFVFASGATATFDRTLRNSVVYDILPREDLSNGLALINMAFSLSRAIAPPIAGALIALTGAAWCFAIQGLLAVGVIFSVLQVRRRPASVRPRRASAFGEMKAGLRYGFAHPVVRLMLLMNVLAGCLLIPTFGALLPIFAADIYRVGPEGLGWMLGAVGLGSIVGSALAAAHSRFDRVGLLQCASLLAFAASLIGFALGPGVAGAMLLLAIAGCAELLLITSTATAMQLSAAEGMRGRVTSLLTLFPACIASGIFLAGVSSDLVGAPATSIGFSSLAACVVLLSWYRSAALRDLRLSGLLAGQAPKSTA